MKFAELGGCGSLGPTSLGLEELWLVSCSLWLRADLPPGPGLGLGLLDQRGHELYGSQGLRSSPWSECPALPPLCHCRKAEQPVCVWGRVPSEGPAWLLPAGPDCCGDTKDSQRPLGRAHCLPFDPMTQGPLKGGPTVPSVMLFLPRRRASAHVEESMSMCRLSLAPCCHHHHAPSPAHGAGCVSSSSERLAGKAASRGQAVGGVKANRTCGTW